MKKLFTFCFLGLIAFCYNVAAQSTRLVLAEEFTQASCPPCASQNPAFNTLLNAHSTGIVAIKYQTNWPGVDPMNASTQSMVGPRVSYYNCTGVPMAFCDGDSVTGSSYTNAPANWTASLINSRGAVSSPFTLAVTHSFNATHDSIFITVDITASQAVNGSLVAHVAIIEREINFCVAPGTNGEKDFQGVMQMMLPSALGTALASSWTLGQTQQLTFATALPSYLYDKNQLAVVSFIQDNSTHEVHQAAYSVPQPLLNDARLVCDPISGVPPVSCGTPLSPSVNFSNLGTANLTSLNIAYSIDGTSQTPIAWTGNLATGATGSVSIPNSSITPGSHTIDVTATQPSGVNDYNTRYDHSTFSYFVSSSVGAALPFTQTFVSSQFPPANWININPDNGYGWSRSSSAGFNGAGSAKMNFYSSPAAEIDELWVPSYDFSVTGTTTAQIEFDVSYCQYSASYNDKIEVLYSIDCGQNWTSVFSEAGSVLANGNPASTSAFTPSNANQWHHKICPMNGAVGNAGVFIKFKATSAYGNNGYIDNINVTTNLTTGINQVNNDQEFNVYPNPSNGKINISLNTKNDKDGSVVITNSLGAVVRSISLSELNKVSSNVYSIDLSGESKGTFQVTVKTNDQVFTKRISVVQ